MTSRKKVQRLNGELKTVRHELTAARTDAVRNTDIRKFQQLVTDLAQRVEDANMNIEMSISVCQHLADRICFVVEGAVHMATINTAAVFEDVVGCLKVGIPQIMAGRKVIVTIIDEESYRGFKRTHPVGTLFAEGERPVGFQ